MCFGEPRAQDLVYLLEAKLPHRPMPPPCRAAVPTLCHELSGRGREGLATVSPDCGVSGACGLLPPIRFSVVSCSGVWDKPPVLRKDPASSRERVLLSGPSPPCGLRAGLTGAGLGGGPQAGAPPSGEGLALARAGQPSEAPESCVVRARRPGSGASSSGSCHIALPRGPADPSLTCTDSLPTTPCRARPSSQSWLSSRSSPAQLSTTEPTRTTSDVGAVDGELSAHQGTLSRWNESF